MALTAQSDFSIFTVGGSVLNGSPALTNGESFTCTLFDNGTSIGSATATASGTTKSAGGGSTSTSMTAQCESYFPGTLTPASYDAVVYLSNGNYNANDTYTWIISH